MEKDAQHKKDLVKEYLAVTVQLVEELMVEMEDMVEHHHKVSLNKQIVKELIH